MWVDWIQLSLWQQVYSPFIGLTPGFISHFSHKYESYFLGQYPCHDFIGASQYFTLSKNNELRNEYMCGEVEKVSRIFSATSFSRLAIFASAIFMIKWSQAAIFATEICGLDGLKYCLLKLDDRKRLHHGRSLSRKIGATQFFSLNLSFHCLNGK